jgi:hypothetical protein
MRGSGLKEESTMKENANSKLSKSLCRSAIAIVAIGIAAAPAIHATPNSNKTADKPTNVVARVQLSGGPVSRMLLVKKNGKEYLLLGLDSSTDVAVLDVSNPRQPRPMDKAARAIGAPSAEVKVVADNLTLFGTSGAGTASGANPKEIRSLSGVTASMTDKARGLTYATNGDGLWIVKTKQRVEADAPPPDYYGGGG